MLPRHAAGLATGLAICLVLMGCTADMGRPFDGKPAPEVDAGASPLRQDGGPPAADAGAVEVLAACPEKPAARPGARVDLTLAVDFRSGDKPLRFKEWNDLPGGGRVMPTNLRLYLSQVALIDANKQFVPVDVVNEAGAPLPYNVHFVNADDPGSLQIRIKAPVGVYQGVSFQWGLDEACNDTYSPRKSPLHEGSQMKWPHTLGFLFLRFEGQTQAASGATAAPRMIHMGGFPPDRPARLVTASGALPITGGGARAALTVALDQILKAATMPARLDDFVLPPPAPPTIDPEILAGEVLRQNATALPIFSLQTGP